MAAARLRVLLSGASGFIGTELRRQLEADGHTVLRLVRREPRDAAEFLWTPDELAIDQRAIDSVDAVVNLAGASTSRIPWTPRWKREMLYSRVRGTQAIAEAIAVSSTPPAVFLNASAVGYYGHRPGVRLTESAPKGDAFLSDLVDAWETAARLTPPTTRVAMFRTGLVVGRGGAFTPLIPLTKLGLAVRMGSGRQHWPWVALYDEAAAIRHLLTSTLEGPVNITGPTPATSREITDALAEALHRWHPWVVPEFALRLLGDAGEELLLLSQDVVPQKLLDDGFEFRYPTMRQAIDALVAS